MREVIGDALDDYVVNLDEDIPLMAQMGTGANRVYSRLRAVSLLLKNP